MTKAFIAYSRKQELFATRLAESLSDVGVGVWLDVDDIPPGMKWHRAIQQGLDACEIMLVIISPESMASDHVQTEYFYFIDEKKPIIPILYKTTPVPALLRPLQYIDFESQAYEQAFAQLHNELKRRGFQLAPLAANYASVSVPTQSPLPLEQSDPSLQPMQRIYWWVRTNGLRFILGAIGAILITVIAAAIIGEGDIRQIISNLISGGTSGTPVAQNPTQEPDDIVPTLSGFQQMQTAEAQQTFAAGTQSAADMTATEDGIRSINATGTAAQIAATETAAYATLLALSATPTPRPTNTPVPPTFTPTPTLTPHPTNTPDPLQAAFTPITSKPDWTPVERDFELPQGGTVTMVLVPVGSFEMGSTEEEITTAVELCSAARQDGDSCPRSIFEDEVPNGDNTQTFTEPFWIDRTEVTRAQYQQCVDAGECEETPDSDFSSEPNQPINRVTWFQAQAYCEWRGEEYRLPTEAEWEYAARGPDSLVYPWGNVFVANNVVYSSNSGNQTAPVGSRLGGASWVGALDMSGNVWEWTSSLYEDYPYDQADGREQDTGDSTDVRRVLRGGSFLASSDDLRSANRIRFFPDVDYFFDGGFRCARSY